MPTTFYYALAPSWRGEMPVKPRKLASTEVGSRQYIIARCPLTQNYYFRKIILKLLLLID